MANLSFRTKVVDGAQLVTLEGDLDETADFSPILATLTGPVKVDLSGVKRINSCGVREWVNFVRKLSSAHPVTLTGCSIPMVEQLNMVFNFRGNASIESFYAPFCCADCEAMTAVLLTPREAVSGPLANRACPACGGSAGFDEIPERYFAFLQDLS